MNNEEEVPKDCDKNVALDEETAQPVETIPKIERLWFDKLGRLQWY